MSLLDKFLIICLQFMILFFVHLALLLNLVHSFLDIPVLLLQELYELTCLIDCVLHHLAISFLASHRYYNMPQLMAFEFSNRIEELTNKLTKIKHNKPQEDRIEEAREQLIALQTFCNREVDKCEKKMKKIEDRLQRRADRVNSESESVDDIWDAKQGRISEVISGWVSTYEQKVEQAFEDLSREEVLFKTKLEEQEDIHDKQAKMMEDKIKNQIKTLEKELGKLDSINTQNHNVALKELSAYKQSLLRDLASSHQMKNKGMRTLENRINKTRELSTNRIEELKDKIEKYSLKTSQIFQLLLAIN